MGTGKISILLEPYMVYPTGKNAWSLKFHRIYLSASSVFRILVMPFNEFVGKHSASIPIIPYEIIVLWFFRFRRMYHQFWLVTTSRINYNAFDENLILFICKLIYIMYLLHPCINAKKIYCKINCTMNKHLFIFL